MKDAARSITKHLLSVARWLSTGQVEGEARPPIHPSFDGLAVEVAGCRIRHREPACAQVRQQLLEAFFGEVETARHFLRRQVSGINSVADHGEATLHRCSPSERESKHLVKVR